MTWNIPNLMAGTVRPVELTLNVDISTPRYNEVADLLLSYVMIRDGERLAASKGNAPDKPAPKPEWDPLAAAVSDLILFDKKKLSGPEFSELIHGEWGTMDQFCVYCTRVMARIGELSERQKN